VLDLVSPRRRLGVCIALSTVPAAGDAQGRERLGWLLDEAR